MKLPNLLLRATLLVCFDTTNALLCYLCSHTCTPPLSLMECSGEDHSCLSVKNVLYNGTMVESKACVKDDDEAILKRCEAIEKKEDESSCFFCKNDYCNADSPEEEELPEPPVFPDSAPSVTAPVVFLGVSVFVVKIL